MRRSTFEPRSHLKSDKSGASSAPPARQALAEGSRRPGMWGALLLVPFLGQARKGTCRRATPANYPQITEGLTTSMCFVPTLTGLLRCTRNDGLEKKAHPHPNPLPSRERGQSVYFIPSSNATPHATPNPVCSPDTAPSPPLQALAERSMCSHGISPTKRDRKRVARM